MKLLPNLYPLAISILLCALIAPILEIATVSLAKYFKRIKYDSGEAYGDDEYDNPAYDDWKPTLPIW